MNKKDSDFTLFKIVISGYSSVGKTSIIQRFHNNQFQQNQYCFSIDFILKMIEKHGKNLKLQIWDTAGQERFRVIHQNYYKGASGVIFVYDISNRESFNDLQNWILIYLKANQNKNGISILIGNKCDLESQRDVQYCEGQELAKSLGIQFFESSAKDSINVFEAFDSLVESIILTQ